MPSLIKSPLKLDPPAVNLDVDGTVDTVFSVTGRGPAKVQYSVGEDQPVALVDEDGTAKKKVFGDRIVLTGEEATVRRKLRVCRTDAGALARDFVITASVHELDAAGNVTPGDQTRANCGLVATSGSPTCQPG